VRSANEKGDCNELPDNMGSLLGPAIGNGRRGHLGRGTGTCSGSEGEVKMVFQPWLFGKEAARWLIVG